MASASAEYAITKRGTNLFSRKRDKPLRTYGRQPIATSEPRSEPLAKRSRVAYAVDGDDGYKNIKPLMEVCTSRYLTPSVAPVARAKRKLADLEDQENKPPAMQLNFAAPARQSILNYFKPAEPAARAIRKVDSDSESEHESTAQQATRPKRRLLRIRPNQLPPSPGEEARNASDVELELHGMLTERKRKLDRGEGTVGAEPRRVRQKPAQKEVQTTLNISSKAAYSECEDCNTVYNPLFGADVKYHTKRHAAHLRAKMRLADNF